MRIRPQRAGEPPRPQNQEPEFPALKEYGVDLTELASQGKLDPVIGREEEIRRTIQVLSRRTKNKYRF
jgi:ATP-dependent Clp protease ATP-binding subunit ClpB